MPKVFISYSHQDEPWKDRVVKLIGVEMEAGVVANAVSQSARRPGFFMVRGVSDLADADKDSSEVKAWRPYACEVAAAWTLDWLHSAPVLAEKDWQGG